MRTRIFTIFLGRDRYLRFVGERRGVEKVILQFNKKIKKWRKYKKNGKSVGVAVLGGMWALE